jgi:hypothetical protein
MAAVVKEVPLRRRDWSWSCITAGFKISVIAIFSHLISPQQILRGVLYLVCAISPGRLPLLSAATALVLKKGQQGNCE